MKPDHQVDAAIEELASLTMGHRGVGASRHGADHIQLVVAEKSWPAKVIVRDTVSKRDAEMLTATEARGSKIVVANQISEEAKDLFTAANRRLRAHGWSWFDRRSELQLNHPGVHGILAFNRPGATSTVGPVRLATARSDGPIRGRAGISAAASYLLPDRDASRSIRTIAAEADMSHGAIGEAVKLLRSHGLILPDGRPAIPELFWALASVWGPTRVTPVAALPSEATASRLGANHDDVTGLGWCVSGDDTAAAWGAPVFASHSRPRIWVTTEAEARRAERHLGAATWEDSVATIAVSPARPLNLYRAIPPSQDRPLPFLPTPAPLFIALDLAQDPARGREILDGWHPGSHRVW